MPFAESFLSTIKSNKSIMLDKSRRFRKTSGGFDWSKSQQFSFLSFNVLNIQLWEVQGSVMSAINSLKNNRNLLSKRKGKSGFGGSYSNIELKEFPKATPEQLLEIRVEMQKQKKKASIKLIISLVAFIVILFLVFWYFIK